MAFRRIPPTVAGPSASALASGLVGALLPGVFAGRLAEEIEQLFPGARTVTFNTGRAALSAAFRAAMTHTGRRTVVLPAFTSFSVAAAAVHAGARPVLCDVDPSTLDFDLEDLANVLDDDTAALVLGNLYGYPSRTTDLDGVRGRGVLIIDDAAQALGATEANELVGGRGDIGVLSFGRGKCVTTGDGGAVVVRRDELLAALPRPDGTTRRRGIAPWIMACASRACTNTWAFGAVSRVPGTAVGESHFEPGFATAPAPASVDGLGAGLCRAVRTQLHIRTHRARTWLDALRALACIETPTPAPRVQPAFLRVPALAPDGKTRDRIAARLARARFRYVGSFPVSLGRIPGFRAVMTTIRPTPNADRMAERVIALPCHAAVSDRDVDRAMTAMAAAFRAPHAVVAYQSNNPLAS